MLSIAEANNSSYFPNGNSSRRAANTDYVTGGGEIDTPFMVDRWWLRSPGIEQDYAANVYSEGVLEGGTNVDYNSFAVRPAFNLDLSSALFISAAVGGKPDGFNAVSEYTGNEWRVTLKDSRRTIYASVAKTSVKAGESLSVKYFGADTGENEYISAMIADEGGNILYYGRLAHNSEGGTLEVAIPSELADGNYILKIFSEQYNGDYKTDYASEFRNISFTVKNTINEQFTLDPGDKYYFDLSALSIPGTANDALPDKTMHYVPFIYVGTVDAYSLESGADTDTTSYEHSLFIADRNVTNEVSWSTLNEKELIYGKTYTSGVPANNEWDAILGKANTYIQNWYMIASWGQDIWSDGGNGQYRSVRGYTSEHFCANSPATGSYTYLEFRPALELPADLSADSLKVVELRTGANMPGEDGNAINIIVKNGESFTAPAAEGLPRPDSVPSDAQLWWADENGNFYKPGDAVPAGTDRLDAFYGGFGLFLDRGDGAVEVTPDNYTDIFGDGSASFVPPQGNKVYGEEWFYSLTPEEAYKLFTTGKTSDGSALPNLKLKNTSLVSIAFNDRYIGQSMPFFITTDGENTIGSINKDVSMFSVLGEGDLTVNGSLNTFFYTQYGGRVTIKDALGANCLYMYQGSLTVMDDVQALYMSEGAYGFYV